LMLDFLRFFSICIFGATASRPLLSFLKLLCARRNKSKALRPLNISSPYVPTLLVLSICEKAVTNPIKGDPLRPLAIHLSRITDWIDGAITIKRTCLKNGIISIAESHALTKSLLQVSNIVGTINERAQSYKTFDSTARADFLNFLLI
jgi:hypothetical protein